MRYDVWIFVDYDGRQRLACKPRKQGVNPKKAQAYDPFLGSYRADERTGGE
tara:strand:+ start:352 stop:504 length:153 start_codon:yes stop_codon:yes gene_type:complete